MIVARGIVAHGFSVYIHACVCLCVCVCVCVYIHIYTYIYHDTHTRAHTNTHTYTHTHGTHTHSTCISVMRAFTTSKPKLFIEFATFFVVFFVPRKMSTKVRFFSRIGELAQIICVLDRFLYLRERESARARERER
jgi:hypothetical protein